MFLIWNVCFDFLDKLYLKYFLIEEKLSEILSYMYIGFHVKYLLFLSDFSESCILLIDFPVIL
jgi:hypothetical protein